MTILRQYLIIYENLSGDLETTVIRSVDMKECIELFINATCEHSDLLDIAMKGLTDYDEMIKMYNHFADKDILAIYVIGETMYYDESLNHYVERDDVK